MTDYVGRHRPPTRAEHRAHDGRRRLSTALTTRYALPTAAAATLALTAGGTAAAQSTAFAAGGPLPSALVAPEAEPAEAAPALDPALSEQATTDVATTVAGYSELAQRRKASTETIAQDQGRAQESRRIARDKARTAKRQELAAAKRRELAAAKKAADRAGLPEGTTLVAGEVGDEQGQVAGGQSWVRPLADLQLTSGYGSRWGRVHAGDDFGVPVGTPLMAMSSGTVTGAGQMQGYGTYVDIRYWDGTTSRYGHMSGTSVTAGQTVAPGQVVGTSGNTGRSTGPHLHLEIHPAGSGAIEPRPWMVARGLVY